MTVVPVLSVSLSLSSLWAGEMNGHHKLPDLQPCSDLEDSQAMIVSMELC